MKRFLALLAVGGIFLSVATGCATKGYVKDQVELLSEKDEGLTSEIKSVRSEMEEDIGKVWKEVEANQGDISTLKELAEKQKNSVEEAISRAGGERKLLYEVTMSDESVFFAYKKSELSKDAKMALDVFANVLLAEKNKDVLIEIQGHTDNIGSEDYNLELGGARGEAVRRYLHMEHKIPLHIMSVFSYGESTPLVPNTTEADRAKNRRVVLLVME
ncbi:MAG: hypothetical protein B6245_02655 [Desulfobacteraceae bacterium 4572_88]|nr:MAG: hypothetical protein B6245_02655 [Desulfobacteraceae bacterium 4572_88]